LFGVAGFLAACALAVPLGRFFETPGLPLVVIVSGVSFIVSGFRTVPFALLQKAFRFKALALLDGAQTVVMAVLAVSLALVGFRYWTLVVASLASALASTIGMVVLRRVRFSWPRYCSLRQVMTFSGHALTGKLSWFVYANADFTVVGKMLGQSALGAYNFAWTMANLPLDKVTAMVGSVTPAFFAAAQGDKAGLRRYLLTLTEGLALVTFPAAFGLALVAPDLVQVLLGDRWESTIVPLQILACYASFRSVQPLAAQVLMVTGDAAWAARLGVLTAVLMPLGFYYASTWGLNAVALAWVLLYPLHFAAVYERVARRIDCPVATIARSIWPAASGSLGMAVVVLALSQIAVTWAPVTRLVASVLAGAATYITIMLTLHRGRVLKFRTILAELRH